MHSYYFSVILIHYRHRGRHIILSFLLISQGRNQLLSSKEQDRMGTVNSSSVIGILIICMIKLLVTLLHWHIYGWLTLWLSLSLSLANIRLVYLLTDTNLPPSLPPSPDIFLWLRCQHYFFLAGVYDIPNIGHLGSLLRGQLWRPTVWNLTLGVLGCDWKREKNLSHRSNLLS